MKTSKGQKSPTNLQVVSNNNTDNTAQSWGTVEIEGTVYNIVDRIETSGKDVPSGTYEVISVEGVKKVIVAGAIRTFSPKGNTIRAKRSPNATSKVTNGAELPPGAIIVSERVLAVLRAITAVTSVSAAEIIEEALPMIASEQGIPEVLFQKIVSRVASTTNPPPDAS